MIIYIGLVLLFTNFMSYVGPGWNYILGTRISRIFLLILILPVVVMNSTKFPRTTLYKCCMWLMTFAFISMIGAYALHDQSFMQSFMVTSPALTFLMFPFMYILKIDEKSLIKLCFFLGLVWVVIMFVQQFTYPTYYFCNAGYHERGGPGMRNGIVRYGTAGGVYGLLMLFYAFQKYLEEGKRKYLVWIIIGLIGVYLTCTRQIIAASAGCLLVGLYLKGKMKVGAFIGILLIGLVIYHYSDALFGEYSEMTENDLGGGDEYVRITAYRFFGLTYNKDNLFAILFGNGMNYGDTSKYGVEFTRYGTQYGLNLNDIGYVGEYFIYGLIYVLIVFYTFYYVFKNRKYISLYLLLYELYMLTTGIMLMHFACYSVGIYGTIMVWYLIDLDIAKNKRKINSRQLKQQKGGYANNRSYNPQL